MKKVQTLVDQIAEELEGAKCYAETYLELKADGNSWAGKYRDMAQQELAHAEIIHDRAVEEINRLRSAYTPPAAMQEEWDAEHKKYFEKTAWIKQMLNM